MQTINQEFLELFSQGISIFDADLNLIRCNKQYLKLLNFPESFGESGTPMEAFFHYNAERGEYGEGDQKSLIRERLDLARQREPHTFERQRPNGTILLIQGTPTEDGGFLTTYTDITELRRAEETLRDDNRALAQELTEQDEEITGLAEEMQRKNVFLQETVESVGHGISFFDRNLELVVANSAFFRIMDFPERLSEPGTPFSDFIQYNIDRGEYGEGDPHNIVETALQRARQFEHHEFRRTRPDGTVLEIVGRPIPQGFVTTYRDVTEEQHSLDALKADREFLQEKVEDNLDEMGRTYSLLQNVLDTIPVRVFWKDRNLEYMGANRLFLQDAGCDTLTDLKGKTDLDLVWEPPQAKAFRNDDQRIIDTGNSLLNIEEEQTRADGKTGWLRTNKVALRDIAGQIVGVIGTYEEITEGKLREAELKESEARFRAIFDQTFQFVGLLEADGKIFEMNKAATSAFDFDADDYRGQQFEDTPLWAHSASKRQKIIDAMDRARTGELVRFDTFSKDREGRKVYLDVSIKPVYDEYGEIQMLLMETRDVSAFVRSQRLAHQSEQWLKALFDHTPLGVIHWNLDHEIIASNNAADTIFGFIENGMKGLHATDFVEEDFKPLVKDIFRELKQNTGGFRSENRNITGDGRIIVCDWYNTPLFDDDGKVYGVASFIDDITDRIQTRLNLEASQERYSLAVQGVKDGIFDWDLDTDQVYLSEIAANILEVDTAADQLTHMDPLRNLPVSEQKRVRAATIAHLQGKTEFIETEACLSRKKGKEKWVLIRGLAKKDEQGRCHRMSGSVNNITQRKLAEQNVLELNEQLEERVKERTGELQKANTRLSETLEELGQIQDDLIQAEKMASLGGLVSGVAHEVNTPIGVGVTATSALIEELERLEKAFHGGSLKKSDFERFFEEARPGSKMVLDNLQRAAELIKSFKQVAVDQSTDSLREINLGEYLGEIVTSLTPNLRIKGVKVETNLESSILYRTDPGAIAQIITNLAMNSVTHAWPEGRGGQIFLGILQDGDVIRIQYKDDGCGMEENVQRNIFEPFFTTKRGEGGSGLGMNITFNLVTQRLGGKISCVSLPGRGAMFDICLPIENVVTA